MDINPKMEIAKRLWEYMKQNPISVAEIAGKIGCTHTTILRLLRGASTAHIEVLLKIEKFLKEQNESVTI